MISKLQRNLAWAFIVGATIMMLPALYFSYLGLSIALESPKALWIALLPIAGWIIGLLILSGYLSIAQGVASIRKSRWIWIGSLVFNGGGFCLVGLALLSSEIDLVLVWVWFGYQFLITTGSMLGIITARDVSPSQPPQVGHRYV